ncbi:MAG: acetoacetate--CoA ligase [Bacteroidales bacterium]|nr:acetoacetate--CoA ligase [Bacteroidales bacterium]
MTYQLLWQPDPGNAKKSRMYDFMQHVNKKFGSSFNDYHQLHRWSIEHPADFWGTFWHYSGIIFSKDYDQVVDDPKKMPGAKWFQGARLNFAENLLKYRDQRTAIIFRGEGISQQSTVSSQQSAACPDERSEIRISSQQLFHGERRITNRELHDQVHRVAEGLRRLGVKKNDRVAGFMPNIPETVIAMLATSSIGAIWSSSSPDFGIKGVLDRFSQIEPSVIFAVDGYSYNGKRFDSQEKLRGILSQLPTIRKVVMVNFTGNLDTSSIQNAISWEELAQPVTGEMTFEQLPFDHPLYIMYSSGTTGLPKSIVHSQGGTLIQHMKELMLHCDVRKDDVVFYFTTCGWMMWNWFVSALSLGATIVCYDGNPFYPEPASLIKMADELNFTLFGTSAKYIASLEAAGVRPKEISDFPKMRIITSTGSPLSDESFGYVYREWKKDVQLASISGGTDIISCFVLGSPVLPVYKGEIQCSGLGMDVDSLDEQGNSVREEKGELVCKTAFPSMPIYFWNDPTGEKYRNAYFTDYEGIWRHGDYIRISDHGGITMFGRSDATLNPGGVRIGTSEIYRVLESMVEIADAVVIGQQFQGDERVILFVQMRKNYELTEEVIKKIKASIRTSCSPRHVPAIIMETPGVPYTLNGKKVEIAVKKMIHGEDVLNRDALANPLVLDYFRDLQIPENM